MRFIALLCFLLFAAWQDYRKGFIGNRFFVVMFSSGLLYYLITGDFEYSVMIHVAGTFLALFVLYRMRVMGAADGKLVMITAFFLGRSVWIVLLLAMVFAAVYGFYYLCRKGILLSRIRTSLLYFYQMIEQVQVSSYCYGIGSHEAVTVPFACCFCAGYIVLCVAKWYGVS